MMNFYFGCRETIDTYMNHYLLKTLFLLDEGYKVGYPDHAVLVDLDVVQECVTLVPGQGLCPALPAQQMPGSHHYHYTINT